MLSAPDAVHLEPESVINITTLVVHNRISA